MLTALGAGFLGSAAANVIENERNSSFLATGSSIWLAFTIMVSLALGSYFAVRVSKAVTNKVGAAHGFVVASIFIILMVVQAGAGIANLSSGLGHIVNGMAQNSTDIANSPVVQDTVNQALAGTELKSEPKEVAQGLAARLLQGKTESAKDYFAYQTGMSEAEADARVAQMQANFEVALKSAGETAAKAVAQTGYLLALAIFFGLLAAVMGGRYGAYSNVERPLAEDNYDMARVNIGLGRKSVLANENGGAIPYILGWLLGVPVSILLLIYLVRAIFG